MRYTEQELSKLATVIADRLSFVQTRKQDLEKVNKDLTEAEDSKMQLLIQTPDLTEEMLIKNFKDFKGLSDSSKRASLDLQDLKRRLEELEIQNMIVDLSYQNPTYESVFLDQISTGLL